MINERNILYKQLLAGLNLKLAQQYLSNTMRKNIVYNRLRNNTEIDIELAPYSVYPVAYLLKNDVTLGNDSILVDIIVADYPLYSNRFIISYNILTLNNLRLSIKSKFNELTSILSITNLWQNASWHERECFDFFGVYFVYHKDLRRILTDYGFRGFALRKDFPLSGYLETYYDDNQKRIITKKTELTQTFKNWAYITTW